MLMGQPRIFFTMARDGLMPKVFGRVHPKHRTPHIGTIIVGAIAAMLAGCSPVNVLGDLVSMGTLLAFATVCIGVLVLRRHAPGIAARVPRADAVAGLPARRASSACICSGSRSKMRWPLLLGWTVIGFLIYGFYGYRHSKLRLQRVITQGRRSRRPIAPRALAPAAGTLPRDDSHAQPAARPQDRFRRRRKHPRPEPAAHARALGYYRAGHRCRHRHRHLRGHRHGSSRTCRPGGAALVRHRGDLQRFQRAVLCRIRHTDPHFRQLLFLCLRLAGGSWRRGSSAGTWWPNTVFRRRRWPPAGPVTSPACSITWAFTCRRR